MHLILALILSYLPEGCFWTVLVELVMLLKGVSLAWTFFF